MRGTRALVAILAAGALVRLGTWKAVFLDGRVYVTENDGWYHLRRAAMTIAGWPHVPRFDAMINAPHGGPITWGVLFDWLLATLALPWPHALTVIGAFLPVALGVAQLALIYLLVRDLRSHRAALFATALAAVLPEAVRHSALGALDHDSFIQTCLVLALWSLVRKRRALLAIAITAAFLAWPGAIVTLAMITCALLAARERALFETAAAATLVAAIAILPWVFTSGWPRVTFEGLSLLHVAVLAGVSASSAGCAMLMGARSRIVIGTLAFSLAIALVLAPLAIAPFVRGVAFAAGNASIQKDVAEGQPLLVQGGRVDVRPLLAGLTLLPLLGIAFSRSRFVLGWLIPALVLAILHMRFGYDAALATAAAAGMAFDTLLGRFDNRRVAALAAVLLITIVPAYVRVRGWERVHLYARASLFHDNGLREVCERLAKRPDGVVWAPWWFGHVILWDAHKPVVTSPFLTIGQSNFGEAARFYFTRDVDDALRMLAKWRVRYVIVTADAPALGSLAAAAGVDPAALYGREKRISARAYVQTVQGRLALIGGFGPFVEIDRSNAIVRGPAGWVPRVRVYEVRPPAPRVWAAGRRPISRRGAGVPQSQVVPFMRATILATSM